MAYFKQHNTKSLYFSDRIIRICEGVKAYPLSIIEAPMGYGKTTTIREYLKNASVGVLWLRVYDNTITSFWNGFVKLFKEIDEDVSNNLALIGFPKDIISMQEVIGLIEEINLDRKTILVIDDYHLTKSQAVDAFIEFIVENEIANLHIVLTLRYANFERLEELKLKGYVCHIKKEDLELTQIDIKKYYSHCGISLTDNESNQLYAHTEGWISALYLFMLEYVAKGSYTPEGSIYQLLEKTVYSQLDQREKEFLVTMCIFDGFTYEQANYMWQKDGTRDILRKLLNNNSFITYDAKLKVYNLHSIFIGYLNDILKEKDRSYRDNLYNKAGQWFLNNKEYFTARRYFYECGNYDSILLALERDKTNDYSNSNKELIKKYMENCPEEVKRRHYYGMLMYALQLFVNKETQLFGETCSDIKRFIDTDTLIEDELRNILLGELELLLSFSEFNDLKKMSARHQKAWEMMKRTTSVYTTGTNWAFGCPSVLCLYYRESGKLKQHVDDLKKGLEYYYRITNKHGFGAEYAMEAECYFNQGDFINAEISLQKASLMAKTGSDRSVILSIEYLQIMITFMKGDISKVDKLSEALNCQRINTKEQRFIPIEELCEGMLYANLGQIEAIPERLLDFDSCNERLYFPAMVFYNILYGRLLLIRGDYLELIGSCEYFNTIASVFPNQLGRIYTYIYLAAAYRKIFRENEAIDSMKKALEIAMPDRVYMPFVANCDYIEPILNEITTKGIYKEEIQRILELYKVYRQTKEKIINLFYTKEIPKLTPREMEIARLAASGMTNSEIGTQLFVSANTVKKALRSIYEKLSINNRALLKQHISTIDSKKT